MMTKMITLILAPFLAVSFDDCGVRFLWIPSSVYLKLYQGSTLSAGQGSSLRAWIGWTSQCEIEWIGILSAYVRVRWDSEYFRGMETASVRVLGYFVRAYVGHRVRIEVSRSWGLRVRV